MKINGNHSNEIYSPDFPGFLGTGMWVVPRLISVKDKENK